MPLDKVVAVRVNGEIAERMERRMAERGIGDASSYLRTLVLQDTAPDAVLAGVGIRKGPFSVDMLDGSVADEPDLEIGETEETVCSHPVPRRKTGALGTFCSVPGCGARVGP